MALICSAAATALAQTVRPHTIEELVSGFGLFDEPLVWVGAAPPPAAESQALWTDLALARSGPWPDGLAALEDFISTHPDSVWVPSLHALLGKAYRDTGRDTLSLGHWEAAWQLTGTAPAGKAKHIGDYTLAHYTRLLASLGRYEQLTTLILQNSGRILDRGALSQKWARTCEAAAEMRQNPGVSYKCGTFALDNVGRALHRVYDRSALLGIPSPETGFSMNVLAALASQFQLGLVSVVRPAGGPLVVPSVVHWRQNHYAAIVEQRGRLYRVVDPTFEQPRWMTFDTIDSEASGAFLVPASQVPPGYGYLSSGQMQLIFGRGNPNFLGDANDQECESCGEGSCAPGNDGFQGQVSPGIHGPIGGIGGPGSCGACGVMTVGMPLWRVSEPYINLWVEDEPLGYQPSTGPRVSLGVFFRQRQENQFTSLQGSSFGHNWFCPWLSAVDNASGARYGYYYSYLYAKGGYGTYIEADAVATNYFNTLKLLAVTNAIGELLRYELFYPTGAKDIYGFAPTNYSGGTQYYYLSQRVSADGRTTSLYYDENYDPGYIVARLMYVVDSDQRTNTFSYTNSTFTNLITQVSDPFGRSAYFIYDGNGILTNVTDVAWLSTSFVYDQYGWVTNMVTPYGTNVFAHVQKSFTMVNDLDRSCTITEANGSKQLYAYAGSPLYEVASYDPSEVPTNTPIGTLDNYIAVRNSYHWGRLQYTLLSTNNPDYFSASDLLFGRMRHWLGDTPHGVTRAVDTLSVEREPSADGTHHGQLTWYDYANKPIQYGLTNAADQGDSILPSVVARVLPDGSTSYTYLERNQWGWTTNAVGTWTQPDGTIGTRTNTYVYDGNGEDLVLQIGPQAEQVVSNYFGTSYHQPDASYDALNQQTTYTYNANRQVTSITTPAGLTTTNIYFGSGSDAGRLSQTIDLQINRTNSYTYYANGLVLTHTDERGLVTTNYWDNLQRLTGVGYPDGGTTNIYSRLDLVGTRDKLGYWTRFAYDAIRRKYAETNANNAVTWITYCECGSPSTITRAYGTAIAEQTTFTYDYQGNRLISAAADGYNVTNWYNLLHHVVGTGDGAGNKWMFYNNQGLLTVLSNAYGALQSKVWDVEDRPAYVTDQNNVTVTNTYDLLGRLQTRGYPDGGVEKFGYAPQGLVAYTNQLGLTNFFAYDPAGRKTAETNANWEVIRYTNNAAGDLLSLTDGRNYTTRWVYDQFGRVTNKLDQTGAVILKYGYDPNSRLTNRWSSAKGTTVFAYDPVGNLTNIDYPSSSDVRLTYDALNRLSTMVDGVGTTAYTYSLGDQVLSEDGPFASDTVTNFYTNRLRTSLALQQPTGVWTNKFVYDPAGRLTNVTSPAAVFGYLLGAAGPASPLPKKLLLPNTSYITNTFDTVARLTSTILKDSGNSALDSAVYGYNQGNQRTAFTNAAGTYVQYGYDRIGQLKLADSSANTEDRGYAYDASWNLTSRTNNGITSSFTNNSLNELTGDTTYTYTYDNNGNPSTKISASSYLQYAFDDENRLVSVYDVLNSSFRTDFVYDGLGRLRRRLEYTNDLGGAGASFTVATATWVLAYEVRYIYDGKRVIQERDGSDVPQVAYTRGTDLSGTLEGAGGIGGLLGRSHGYSGGNWSTHNFYHADGNGNITYVVNASQLMAASYRYDPFGNTISKSGSLADANVYRFSSKEFHVNSGLYYYLYRFYDPQSQRWMTRDPIEQIGFYVIAYRFGGQYKQSIETSPNLHAFVFNRPLDLYDAFGLEPKANGGRPGGGGFSCQVKSCTPKDMQQATQHCQEKYGPTSFAVRCKVIEPIVPITIGPVTFEVGFPIMLYDCVDLNDFPGGMPGVGPGIGIAWRPRL